MSAKKAANKAVKTTGKKRGPREKEPFQTYALPPDDPHFDVGMHLRMLAVDPLGSDQLAIIFGPVIAGFAGDNGLKFAGVMAMMVLRDGTPDMFKELLERLLAMKTEYLKEGGDKHRHWHILKGFADFTKENGRKPASKPELRKWLQQRSGTYKNLPTEAAGWTRAWKGAHLDAMPDR